MVSTAYKFRSLIVIAAVLACVTGGSVLAQNSAAPAAGAYKIGVVDMQRLVVDYPKRKDAYDRLQQEVDALQTDIDNMSANIEAAKKSYEVNSPNMTAQQQLDTKNKIEADYAEYRIELEKRQRIIDNKEESVMKDIMTSIEQAIAQIAAAENFHLILNSRGSVLYSQPSIDITPKVQAALK